MEKVLHRNLMLSIGTLPIEEPVSKPKWSERKQKTNVIEHITKEVGKERDKAEDSDSDMSEPVLQWCNKELNIVDEQHSEESAEDRLIEEVVEGEVMTEVEVLEAEAVVEHEDAGGLELQDHGQSRVKPKEAEVEEDEELEKEDEGTDRDEQELEEVVTEAGDVLPVVEQKQDQCALPRRSSRKTKPPQRYADYVMWQTTPDFVQGILLSLFLFQEHLVHLSLLEDTVIKQRLRE